MTRVARPLFVATILVGSFLLFLVQPMVARMALPRLGGAPNVWNSAMLVYQALLLGGYGYAHALGRLPLRRQVAVHVILFALAALTLPIGLAQLPPPTSGTEALWVPALLALSIGPVFLLVSAQAPLMQRWFAADPRAGEPWALYAASNLGSFAGLIAYPLLVEPLTPTRWQSWGWSAGYIALLVLIALAGRSRWQQAAAGRVESAGPAEADRSIAPRRIALWLALSAVPSGLMLSTTTHLTTDLFAMPLLWVIPLGIYLLSFSIAFADGRGAARAVSALAWPVVLGAGGLAMVSQGSNGLIPVFASLALLGVVCVALHARLYDSRPDASRLTLFYLVMSAGGALGGMFTALVAPLVFDWVWEHPLLVLAAAALLPQVRWFDWRRMGGLEPAMRRIGAGMLVASGLALCWLLHDAVQYGEAAWLRWTYAGVLVLIGVLLSPWRWLVLALLLETMLAQGGAQTIDDTLAGRRTRSYFGVYTVRTSEAQRLRILSHGTTLHGEQSTDPALARQPMTYYGPGSGAGIALSHSAQLLGPYARIGVVGLGAGTLACYRQPGQNWTFFEIDPAILAFSQRGTFTYLRDCAPDARVVIGDARLELAKQPRGAFDMLVVDAFSSDAIPLHLLTEEAIGVYLDALPDNGLLLIHISNRFIRLEPVLEAAARRRGLAIAVRDDNPEGAAAANLTASSWVAMARTPARLAQLEGAAPSTPWIPLGPPAPRVWTDDHASILPYIQWRNFLGKPQ